MSFVNESGPTPPGTALSPWTRNEKIRTLISLAIIAALLVLAYRLSGDPESSNASISLLIGISLGLILERGRFCFFCIFRDGIEDKSTTPFLSILAAIATGSIGYAIILGQFLPDTSTDRLPPAAHIGPVSWVLALAAFSFGIGMTLSGACISGHLYRLGQGYLRAIPALFGTILGFILAFLTWNSLYSRTIADAPTLWLPHYLGYAGSLILTLLVLLAIAAILMRRNRFEQKWTIAPQTAPTLSSILRRLLTERWSPVITGTLVGIVGTIAYLRIEPLGVTRELSSRARSIMESNQLGPEMLNGLDLMAGCIAIVSEAFSNNGWLILGLVFASFAAALAGGRFQLARPTLRNSSTALIGGVLLGWGSMTALGCTIGVLLSGTQAFALSGWVFFALVFAGSYMGIKLKLHRS
jgi:uncharacterized membrane protein YedE/YeeE